MRRVVAACLLVLATAGMASGDSFTKQLEKGQALLKTGDYQDAIALFRDLQVDQPDSEVLKYDLGCAHYGQAMKEARAEAMPDAQSTLQQAVESFEQASMTSNDDLRRRAQFNRATALGQIAKTSVNDSQPDETLAKFEQAVNAFDDYMRQYPSDENAQTNLSNLRYEWKRYMQQMPPPQNQSGSGQNNDQSNQDKNQQQQNQNQQQNQGQGQQQQDNNQQKDNQQQNQQGNQENEDEQQQQEEQQSSENQQQTAEANPEESQSTQAQETEENRENVEAILQTLQDIDQNQQREMRQQQRRLGIRSKWW